MAEAAGQGDKLNVFISYSRDDIGFADQLDAALGLAGFGASIDRQGISGGEEWEARLGALIRDADTVVFVLSPSSARSKTCAWEVEEAVRLRKRIIPVLCRPLEDASPPPQLADLNYIFFYAEPRFPGSGFGSGLVRLASALNTDLDWLREHTRYLQRATEWDVGGRPTNRLLSGPDVSAAKDWATRRPKMRRADPLIFGRRRNKRRGAAAREVADAQAAREADGEARREAQARKSASHARPSRQSACSADRLGLAGLSPRPVAEGSPSTRSKSATKRKCQRTPSGR